MNKKNNGKKAEPPKALPPEIKLTREQTLELQLLSEQRRRIDLELNALNEDNDKNRRNTAALRAALQEEHDGVDVLGKYALDFDSQTGRLMQQQGPPAPAPAIVETDAEDEDVPEPVASA